MPYQKQLAIKFPYLFPITPSLDKYYGHLELTNGKTGEFLLTVPNYPKASNCILEIDENSTIQENILKIDTTNLNIIQYLDKVKDILQSFIPAYKTTWDNFGVAYTNLIDELQLLEYEQTCTAKWDFKVDNTNKIIMSITDDYFQLHKVVIEIDLSANDGNYFSISNHNLPENTTKSLFNKFNSLKTIYEQYCKYLNVLEDFYKAMKAIDDMCWVLDPKAPCGNENYRVLVVSENNDDKVYMTITLNPWRMDTAPSIRVCGYEETAEVFNKNIKENLCDWWIPTDILTSLLRLLNIPFFPTPSTDQADNDDFFGCSICYLDFDNQQSVVCKCKSYFHTQCLYEWFRSTNSRISFNTIQGPCPTCDQNMLCPVPITTD